MWFSSWSCSLYIWLMCCLKFCRVQFVVLLPLYLAYVLSELLKGPVPGFTHVIFGGCVVWTFVGSSSWFYSCYIWWIWSSSWSYSVLFGGCVFWIFVGSSSWFYFVIFSVCVVWTLIWSSSWIYSHYIWWMCCLNFYRVQFLVLLPLCLVDALSELL